jgi:hypothetical protein
VGGDPHASDLIRLNDDDTQTVIASGYNGPWNGVTFYRGDFYICEAGFNAGGPIQNIKPPTSPQPPDSGQPPIVLGRILKITPAGVVTPLLENLPGLGEFHTNGPLISGGYLYFGQGSATNWAG